MSLFLVPANTVGRPENKVGVKPVLLTPVQGAIKQPYLVAPGNTKVFHSGDWLSRQQRLLQ